MGSLSTPRRRPSGRFVAFWLCAFLVVAPGPPARGATWFVNGSSSSCSNSRASSEARPYCSISAAVNARGGPGDTILVAPGVYREQITVNRSGAPGAPLTLLAAAGGVVVDGADDFSDPARWAHSSGDVWLAQDVASAPAQVFADGARLAPAAGAPASLPARSFTWVSGAGLYVNAGGGSPAGHRAEVGHRKYGFSLFGRSWIALAGFTVLHTEDRGILLAGSCAHVAVTRDTVRFADKMGIQVSGGREILLASNCVSDNNDHGIALIAGASACTLADNESFRNARPGERAANGIYLFGSPRNMLRGNRLHDNQDTGLHLQSGSDSCIAYLNRSWNNSDHGYDHLRARGTIHICDVAYRNYRDGFSIEGDSPGTQIYNSIAVENGLTRNGFDLWIDLGSTPGFVSNHNLFWNSTRQPPVKYIAALYSSVAAYSVVSGQDARSLQADPRFVNPAPGDFRLQADSPIIRNAGFRGPGWSGPGAFGCSPADVAATQCARLTQVPELRRP